MTRAEQAALIEYPKSDFQGVETSRKTKRKCYINGYQQAEKELKNGLLVWAEEHLAYYEKMLKNYPNEREYMAFVGAYQNMVDKLKEGETKDE